MKENRGTVEKEEAVILYPALRKACILPVDKTGMEGDRRFFLWEGRQYYLSPAGAMVAEDGGRLRLRRRRWYRYYYRAGEPEPIVPSRPQVFTAEDLYLMDRTDVAERGVSAAFRGERAMAKLGAWKWVIILAALSPAIIGGIYLLMRVMSKGGMG